MLQKKDMGFMNNEHKEDEEPEAEPEEQDLQTEVIETIEEPVVHKIKKLKKKLKKKVKNIFDKPVIYVNEMMLYKLEDGNYQDEDENIYDGKILEQHVKENYDIDGDYPEYTEFVPTGYVPMDEDFETDEKIAEQHREQY